MLEGLAVALANIDDFIETHQELAHAGGRQGRPDGQELGASLVREMLSRTEGDCRALPPEGLAPEFGLQDGCTACRKTRRARSCRCACSA